MHMPMWWPPLADWQAQGWWECEPVRPARPACRRATVDYLRASRQTVECRPVSPAARSACTLQRNAMQRRARHARQGRSAGTTLALTQWYVARRWV